MRSSFEPHPLLRGPHRQTIYGAFGRWAPSLSARRERFELPDGDFVDLEHIGAANGARAVLIHGLGGSARSPYIRALAATLVSRGWAVTAFQFRGASGTPNRRARSYHSGDTGDLATVAGALAKRAAGEPLVAVGFSMGGNVLLKLLAEQGSDAAFDAAVAVSVPYRLAVCADRLDRGRSRIYGRYLLAGLKRLLRAKRALVSPRIDYRTAMAARSFRRFDEAVTAPLGGFDSADDYYARASSRGVLERIRRPTLLVHALDDPFMLPSCVPERAELPPSVELETFRHGGHVGFFERGRAGLPRSFIERRVARWLTPWVTPSSRRITDLPAR